MTALNLVFLEMYKPFHKLNAPASLIISFWSVISIASSKTKGSCKLRVDAGGED